MNKISHKPIINIYGHGQPVMAVIGCLHGDEIVGKKIIDNLAKEKISKGTLITIIGNPLAVKKNKRFIKKDLNRSFPGNKTGIMEERNAYLISQAVKRADYVIDIHSTTTQGQDFAIIKGNNGKLNKLLKIINFKEVVIMPRGVIDAAVINFCPGITFEFNKSKYKKSVKKPTTDIKKCLVALGLISPHTFLWDVKSGGKDNNMITPRHHRIVFQKGVGISGKNVKKSRKKEYYKVYEEEKRPKGFIMSDKVKNFNLVKKGSVLGAVNGKKVLAKENFYPVLFGEDSYKNIMGFKAHRGR